MSNIKPRPTAGFRYKVVNGDRLDNIEKSAYGYITGNLESANPQLSGRPISLENRPTIYAGDILNIPLDPNRQKLKSELAKGQLSGKDPNDVTLIIADIEIPAESIRIRRTMDTPADGWSCRIEWTPGQDVNIDKIVLPYTYPLAQVYIGNNLVISGNLYSVAPEQSKDGLTITMEGFSFAADILDSTMPTPYEQENITLEDRANQLLQHIGIKAVFEGGEDEKFDRVTGDVTDKIFDHLNSLASQRGLLISSTPEGNLLFTKPSTAAPVGTIKSGDPLPIGWGAKFDGRKLFNQIKAIGESPGNVTKSATVTDKNIPRSRFMTYKADNTKKGDIEQAARWKRAKQFADALTLPYPVTGFYAPNGELWKENTLVTVVSPEIFIPNGFTFLIRQVEYTLEKSGRSATLSLVPPSVYTTEEIELPWEVVG
jgi:prophage tail gpP-like protein